MFTPRFGEITNYDDVITEAVCKNIIEMMNLDSNKVWFISYIPDHLTSNHTILTPMVSDNGIVRTHIITGMNYVLIDNYLNKYVIIKKEDNTLLYPCDLSINNPRKFINPKSDDELTLILRYYSEFKGSADTNHRDNKIKEYKLYDTLDMYKAKLSELEKKIIKIEKLQNENSELEQQNILLEENYNTLNNNNELLQKSLQEKFNILVEQNELLLETNKQYKSSIQELNIKIIELEKLQNENSSFMKYLKKLFVWN